MLDDFFDERAERLVTWVLLGVFVLSLVGVGYVAIAQPVESESYTEFYILGSGGNATNYPTNLSVGQTGSVIVGISNHENEDITYSVVFELGGSVVTTNAITVGHAETREELMSFTPETEGRQRLRILLYTTPSPDATAEPYRHLRLWIDVSA